MAETRDLVMHEVTADHPFGQSRLVRLIDHPAVAGKIRLAVHEKLVQRHFFFDAAAPGMPRAYPALPRQRHRVIAHQLDLPNAIAAAAAALLEHARYAGAETRRKFR